MCIRDRIYTGGLDEPNPYTTIKREKAEAFLKGEAMNKKGLLFDFNGTMFFDSEKHKDCLLYTSQLK